MSTKQTRDYIIAIHTVEDSTKPQTQKKDQHVREHARWVLVKKVRADILALLAEAEQAPTPSMRGPLYRGLRGIHESLLTQQKLTQSQNLPVSQALLDEEKKCLEELQLRLEQLGF